MCAVLFLLLYVFAGKNCIAIFILMFLMNSAQEWPMLAQNWRETLGWTWLSSRPKSAKSKTKSENLLPRPTHFGLVNRTNVTMNIYIYIHIYKTK